MTQPRLMKCHAAAEYLGLPVEVFVAIGLPWRKLDNLRRYDRLDLDHVSREDIEGARGAILTDSVFGIDRPLPDLQEPRDPAWRQAIKPSLRQRVFDRDGEQCQYCGTKDGPWHIDHIHPVSRGGSNTLENLTVACAPCNLSKSAMTVDEWKRSKQ